MSHFWKERAVLVTGGSSGLGRAIAHEFALRGARVMIAARGAENLAAAATELRKVSADAMPVAADVTKQEDVDRMIATMPIGGGNRANTAGAEMRCGGCAAKIGPGPPARSEIAIEPPLGVNLTALSTMFVIASNKRSRSPQTLRRSSRIVWGGTPTRLMAANRSSVASGPFRRIARCNAPIGTSGINTGAQTAGSGRAFPSFFSPSVCTVAKV